MTEPRTPRDLADAAKEAIDEAVLAKEGRQPAGGAALRAERSGAGESRCDDIDASSRRDGGLPVIERRSLRGILEQSAAKAPSWSADPEKIDSARATLEDFRRQLDEAVQEDRRMWLRGRDIDPESPAGQLLLEMMDTAKPFTLTELKEAMDAAQPFMPLPIDPQCEEFVRRLGVPPRFDRPPLRRRILADLDPVVEEHDRIYNEPDDSTGTGPVS